MKRIFLLIPLLLLAACGLDTIPEDGLTNAVIFNEGVAAVFENYELTEVTVNKVWTDMRPLANSNQASVTYRLELAEDLLKLGGDGPFYLYGSGLLQVKDEAFTFAGETAVQGQSETAGQMRIWLPNEDANAPSHGLPLELTAQIDAFADNTADVIITGLAVWPGQEPAILTNNENIAELEAFQCQGVMVPGSSQATISFTAETADGLKFAGGGILETGVQTTASGSPQGFECSMEGEGQIVRLDAMALDAANPVTYGIMFETFKSGPTDDSTPLLEITIPTLRLRSNGDQGQQIMFETFMTAVASTK